MRAAGGVVAEMEAQSIAAFGLKAADFEAGGAETRGTRRLMRVRVGNLQWAFAGSSLELSFELPAGSYATVLLGELLKNTAQFDAGVGGP